MKKWIGRMAVLLAFVLTLSGSTLAVFGEIPSATKEFYVNDYAGIFSDTWKEELCKAGEQLYDDTTAQLVVLTVDTTDGEDISDYAVETGRKWGIGSKKKNNGILIVLSVSDRKVWVSVGYGLEGKLPDSKTGRLLDEYAVPSYKDNQFEKGTVELYYAMLNEIREEYGLEKITQAAENANVAKMRTKKANKVATKRMKLAGKLLSENKKDAFYDEVLKALWGYISDKLNIPVSRLSKDNIEEKLRNHGVSEELIKEFLNALNDCEFARFAPGDENQAMDKVYSSSIEVISKMENSIKH